MGESLCSKAVWRKPAASGNDFLQALSGLPQSAKAKSLIFIRQACALPFARVYLAAIVHHTRYQRCSYLARYCRHQGQASDVAVPRDDS